MTVPEFVGLLAVGWATTALMFPWLKARAPGFSGLRVAPVLVPQQRTTGGARGRP